VARNIPMLLSYESYSLLSGDAEWGSHANVVCSLAKKNHTSTFFSDKKKCSCFV
jgi:hypothetical protein